MCIYRFMERKIVGPLELWMNLGDASGQQHFASCLWLFKYLLGLWRTDSYLCWYEKLVIKNA